MEDDAPEINPAMKKYSMAISNPQANAIPKKKIDMDRSIMFLLNTFLIFSLVVGSTYIVPALTGPTYLSIGLIVIAHHRR